MYTLRKILNIPITQMDFLKSLIGKTETRARDLVKAQGMTFRITMKDGSHYVITMDYRTDRVNIHLVDNKVIKADVG
jgi:hypothetical protein